MLEPALEYAMAAEDEERAARLVARLGQATMNAGRVETIRRWFGWFETRGAWDANPRLAAQAIMAFALDGDLLRSDRWSGPAKPADAGVADDVTGLIAVARAFRCQDGVAQMRVDAGSGVDSLAEDDPYYIAALGLARALEDPRR